MKYTFLIAILFATFHISAQQFNKVTPAAGETLPEWAIKMYGENPNIWEVDDEYRIWRQSHQEEKTTYTQYYKKWRRAIEPFINNEGFEQRPNEAEIEEFNSRLITIKNNNPDFYQNRDGLGW